MEDRKMNKKMVVLISIVLTVTALAGLIITGCSTQQTTSAPAATTAAKTTTTAPITTATMAAPTTAVQPVVNLKFTFASGPQGPLPEANQWFVDEIAKRTNGAVVIKIYFAGTLLAMQDTLPGIGNKIVEAGVGMGRFTIPQNPNWSTMSLLGAGDNLWAIIRAGYDMNTTNKAIIAELAAQNVVPTYGYSAGTPIYVLKKNITSLADLKGLRMSSASPDEAKIMPQLGIEPVQMLMPDSYDALDKGVLNGAAGTIAIAQSVKFQEVAKYWMQMNNNLPGGDVTALFNKAVWDAFTPETRTTILQVASDFCNVYAQKVIDSEAATLKAIQAQNGVTLFKAPADIQKAYQDALSASRETYFKQYPASRDIWAQYQALVVKYQTEFAAKGYPWQR
jgi:TRAP-type transport system periplasmic protein